MKGEFFCTKTQGRSSTKIREGLLQLKELESRINMSLKQQITSSPNNWFTGEAHERQNTDIPALYVVLLMSFYDSWLRLRIRWMWNTGGPLSLTHPL